MIILAPNNVVLRLDASLKETYTANVEVTKHTIEKGGSISDNASKEPVEIEIEGIVTDAEVAGNTTTAYQQWNDLREKLVTVIAGYDSYDDMALTKLKMPRDEKTGESIKVEASFRHVDQVVLQQTTVSVKKSKGTQSTKNAANGTKTPPPRQGLYSKFPGARRSLKST